MVEDIKGECLVVVVPYKSRKMKMCAKVARKDMRKIQRKQRNGG